ncbi:MAG: redoxin domain-containing protein [Pirellulales bacterium]|nr:redoxin domain-containing protein [Pirellulales bacterium]
MTIRAPRRRWLNFGLPMAVVLLVGGAAQAAELRSADEPARFLSALDLEGRAHRLAGDPHRAATVLVFMTTECPIAPEYVPELNRLAAEFCDKHVEFYGVLADRTVKRTAAVKFAADFKIEFPVLFDASGDLASTLGPTHVPEAFVLDPHGALAYHGRIDDRYAAPGQKRPQPTVHDLSDAVAAVLAGRPVETAVTEPVGCPLEKRTVAGTSSEVTFNRDIAPILFAQCAECHRPGEVAPFSLLTYEDAAKRADFLHQVTSSRRMPPWKAEISGARFVGERHLTEAQLALFEAWAKAGAPQGDPADLPPQPQFASGWRLGEPDLVVTAPEPYTLKAGTEDVFQHFIIPLEAAGGKTVVGFEFRPGNPAIVHHAILFLDRSGTARAKDAATPEPGYTTSGSIDIPVAGMLGVWTPGMTPRFYPEGIGMPVEPGTDLVLQLHLHPTGKDETDQSSVALYYADEGQKITAAQSIMVVGTLMIDIPAGASSHEVRSSVTLPTDVTLISLLPHLHLVGKEFKITATLPDRSEQSLMWIKDWDFYWQDNYVYEKPLTLPAGTQIDVLARYDNSSANPSNPSTPPARVLFGNESDDEMCFGLFQVVAQSERDQMKVRMAFMKSFMEAWQRSPIDEAGRAQIVEEAGKLFGAQGSQFLKAFGNAGKSKRKQRPDKQSDTAEASEESSN